MDRSKHPRTWAINGDFVALQPTGVARYAREVTLALDELISEQHPLAANLQLRLIAPRQPAGLPLTRIAIGILSEFRKPRLPQFWVQVQLPPAVRRDGLISLCNLAPAFKTRQIVCIHDVHTRLMPESYSLAFRMVHHILLPIVGRNAQRVTTVSAWSKDLLQSHLSIPRDKISVTYNGSDHALRWRPASSALVMTNDRPFILAIARREKYKNTGLILEVASKLEANGIDVVLAGDLPVAGANGLPRNIRAMGRVSDDDLALLYSQALCTLFPSRIEGFGLPAVEAMRWNCPVLASTSPCLPETCGDAALFANPDDAQQWTERVLALRDQPELRHRLIEAGRRRASAFSWRRIGEQYLELMAAVDRAAGHSLDWLEEPAVAT